MRFGRTLRTAQPDNALRPASQWRLFKMVALLGFVIIAIQWSAQERNWRWITALDDPAPAKPESIPLTQLNFQVRPPVTPEGAPVVEQLAPSTEATALATQSSTDLPVGLLDAMDDRRLGMLRAEQATIATVVEQVRTLSDEALQRAAKADVGFVTLNDRPAEFRGQLLRYEGRLWRLSLFDAGQPSTSDDDLYEAWLFTPDAANNPTRLLCTAVDPSLKLGEEVDQFVAFEGYFIKRYGYATATGMHVAPLFVGKTLHARQAPSGAVPPPPAMGGGWAIGLLLVIAGAILIRLYFQFQAKPIRNNPLPERLPDLEFGSHEVGTSVGIED